MRDAQATAPAPNVQPVQYDDSQPPPPQDPIADRSKAARIREPLRQQRRSEPASGERASGRWSEHVATQCAGTGRCREPVGGRSRRCGCPSHDAEPPASPRTRPRQFPQQAPTPLAGVIAFVRAAPNSGPDAADQRRRAAASRARGHGHRHRADESAGWHERRARELPRDECALLAHGTAGADSRRRADSRRNEARAGVRRDAAGRVLPSPVDARRPHLPPRSVPRTQSDRRRRPPRQGEPALLVHVRSGGRGRPDQRAVPVPGKRWSRAAAMAIERSSSPAASATRRRRRRSR